LPDSYSINERKTKKIIHKKNNNKNNNSNKSKSEFATTSTNQQAKIAS
jgi:hypothetical protein